MRALPSSKETPLKPIPGRHTAFAATRCALALGLLILPGTVFADDSAPSDTTHGQGSFRLTSRDLYLASGGAAMLGVGRVLLNPRKQDVPAGGLDSHDILFAWDRKSLEVPDTNGGTVSTALLGASVLYPTVLGWAFADDGGLWRSPRQAWRIQTEACLLAMGATSLIKVAASRPRPYTYLPLSERPDEPAYDVTRKNAFVSFPSGHAALAWASTMGGVSYLATQRPDLPSFTHFLSGFVGGGMATATSILRVHAGKHFPTDVAAGTLVGGSFGVGVALLHKPDHGASTARAWRAELLGVAAGAVAAALLSPPTSPFFD